jgi:hypothetical protein
MRHGSLTARSSQRRADPMTGPVGTARGRQSPPRHHRRMHVRGCPAGSSQVRRVRAVGIKRGEGMLDFSWTRSARSRGGIQRIAPLFSCGRRFFSPVQDGRTRRLAVHHRPPDARTRDPVPVAIAIGAGCPCPARCAVTIFYAWGAAWRYSWVEIVPIPREIPSRIPPVVPAARY